MYRFYLLLIFLIVSCKKDIKFSSWNTDILLPVAFTELSIDDIIAIDTNLSFRQNNNQITLSYNYDLENLNLDSLLKIEARVDEYSVTLDSVSFNDIVISDTATIGSLVNQIPLGTIIFPNGSNTQIPALPSIISNDTINIDASDYFDFMTLHSGYLSVEIINNFPTVISNVDISLINMIDFSTIANFYFPLINSGSSVIDSISIAGLTIPENVVGILNNLDVNQSNGAVGINYDDALITNFTLSKLGFISASAIFPEQELYVKREEQIIDLDPIQLREVKIKSGTVTINVLSTLPNGKLIYKIPSLKRNGTYFNSGDIIIPENTSTKPTQYVFNFDDYVLDLSGKENRLNGDTVNTIYTELFIFIDSTGALETINEEDSFYTFIQFDIDPDYGLGFIGTDTINMKLNDDISVFNDIDIEYFNLESAFARLNLDNYIGADIGFKVNQFETQNNSEIESIGTDQYGNNIIGNNYFIQRASHIIGSNYVNQSNFSIDSECSKLIEIKPNLIDVDVDFYINPNGQGSELDFLFTEQTVEGNITLEVPLSLNFKNLYMEKEILFSLENNEDVEKVYLNFNNSLPIDLHINIINPLNNDSIINNKYINSAIVDNQGFVLESSNTNVELNYDDLIGTEKLLINANISSTDMTEDIKISNLNKLIFSLSVKYKNRIN
tara:strand:- start:3737 stop:5746 length:2010 start_codon:yes stop_codon:yes gene_type:complete